MDREPEGYKLTQQCGNCKWWDRDNVENVHNEAVAKCLYVLPKLPSCITCIDINYMDFRDGDCCPCHKKYKI